MQFKKGDRILLIEMRKDPRPVQPMTFGTVDSVDGMGQVHVRWDTGSGLALIPEVDRYFMAEDPRAQIALQMYSCGEDPEDIWEKLTGQTDQQSKVQRFIKVAPGEGLVLQEEQELSLSALQSAVGGYIEVIPSYWFPYFTERNIRLIGNEDALLIGLEPSMIIALVEDGKLRADEILRGPQIFVGVTENGDTVGLSDDQIQFVLKNIYLGPLPFLIINPEDLKLK